MEADGFWLRWELGLVHAITFDEGGRAAFNYTTQANAHVHPYLQPSPAMILVARTLIQMLGTEPGYLSQYGD
jgi:hypothetical protein